MRAQKGGSQVYKELPRTFLPQKFHWATVIALALGLEGGSKRAACVCAGGGRETEWGGNDGGSGSAPQTRLLPHTCFRKTKGETGPRVEEGQGPTLRTLQSHEKTQRYLFGISRANATDLPVFRNGRDVVGSWDIALAPSPTQTNNDDHSRLRNVLFL